MEQVPDLSKFSEEEQRILRDVMSRAQDEEEKDRKDFRKEEKALSILESAVLLRQREKSDIDLTTTCNICFQTKFADGVGHICESCHTRCCARCGVKVIKANKKQLWLCVLCRKKKELAYKFSKYLKSDAAAKSWGRSRSLEEEASSRRLATTPLSAMTRRFPSALNITAPFFGNKEQQQPNVRSDPLPPRRGDLHHQHSTPQQRSTTYQRNSPPFSQQYPSQQHHQQQYHEDQYHHHHHQQQPPQQQQQLTTHRYTRRRSSLDTIRNDSLSSDQSENPPSAAPQRPKPSRKGGNGGQHRYRRSGSSGSEDEARSSPSSCQDSESDRVSVQKDRRPVVRGDNRWMRSQEELTTSVSDYFQVVSTASEMHAPSSLQPPSSCDNRAELQRAIRHLVCSDRNVAVLFDEFCQENRSEDMIVKYCQDNRSEDQFDIVGRNVAAKLRALPKRQRIIAEKIINETLFEAELGTLNRNSKINVL